MAGIISVERFNLVLASGETTASGTLTKSQNTDNCIPFRSGHFWTDTPADRNEFDHILTDVYFSGSTVVAERGLSSSSATETHITVVEFDSDLVEVKSGAWEILASSTTDSVTISGGVDEDATFCLAYQKGSASTRISESNAIPIRFWLPTGGATIEIDRISTIGNTDGTWYTAESLSGDFAVQHGDIVLTGGSSDTLTLSPSVTTNKTFVISSWKATGTGDDNNDLPTTELTNGTTISAIRDSTGGTVTISCQAIEFAGDENVQRGKLYQSAATASETLDITEVDLDVAMPWNPSGLNMKNVSMSGTSNDDNSDAFVNTTLLDSDTLEFEHNIQGGEADNYIAWEVVEWDVGGAAPASRRVMVIS